MFIRPKRIIARFNTTATAVLEAAVVEGSRRGVPKIGAAMFLFKLLEQDASGASQLFDALGVDRALLREQLYEIATNDTSSQGRRPVFDDGLFQWFQDAWLFTSLELDAPRIETAHLGAVWLVHQQRYVDLGVSVLDCPSVEDLTSHVAECPDPEADQASAPRTPRPVLARRVLQLERSHAALEESLSARLDALERRLASSAPS